MSEEHEGPVAAVADLATSVKPRLRGWLHLAMFPIALVGGLVLVLLAEPGPIRTASIIFTITATLLDRARPGAIRSGCRTVAW